MSGAGLTSNFDAIKELRRRVDKIRDLDREWLLEFIGATVESQTRRRITDDKESPDGSEWPKWSKKYAATRHSGKSFLQDEGFLLASMCYVPGMAGDTVEIGSNMVYALTHQKGDEERNIPARPYLGLSQDDENDLEKVIDDFLLRLLP